MQKTAVTSRAIEILVKLGAFDKLENRESILNRFGYEAYDYNKFELEILGYNRVHVLEKYWETLNQDSFSKLKKVSTMEPKQAERFLAAINSLDVKKDKKGRDYAIVTLYDGETPNRGLIWNETYKNVIDIIKEGNVILFSGTKSNDNSSLFLTRIEKVDLE